MSDTPLHLGLDAGELSLKAVLYDASEKSILHAASLELPVPALSDIPTFEQVLGNWLTEVGVTEPASVSLTVSSFRAIVRQIFVPAEVPDIKEYLDWYLSTIVNDDNRYFIDFQKLAGSEEDGWTVLFIALRKDYVEAVRKGFRSKKLVPQLMNVDVISLLNLLEVVSKNPSELRCVVKADIAGVSLMWISKENLRLLRGVSTLDLVGRDSVTAYKILANSIAKQIEEAAMEHGVKTDSVNICGDVSTDPEFLAVLRNKLPGIEVSPLLQFEQFKNPEDESEAALIPLCIGALGVAVQAGEEK